MKTNSKSVLGLATLIIATHALPVQAINREWAAVAGFAGGVLVANAVSCNRGYSRQVYYQQPPVVVYQQPVQTVVVQQPVRQGYYRWETERIWVPGCWQYEDRGCGTVYKVWQPGYHQLVKNRVWVDTTYAHGGW